MLSFTSAQAADTYWTNPGSGDWFVAANWSVGVPVPGYLAYVENGGTALIGSGQAWAGSLYIGGKASGGVKQSGGGLEAGTVRVRTSGIYGLSAGTLGVTDLYVAGTSSLFNQTGGSATVAGKLVVSENIGDNSVYALGGSGTLSVKQTTVGCWGSGVRTGLFQQTGGTHSVETLYIQGRGRYEMSGGMLRVTSQSFVRGEFACPSGTPTLALGPAAFVDFFRGTLSGMTNLEVATEANSLLMLPAGFDPATGFRSLSGPGVVHVPGTTLFVPAGCKASIGQDSDDARQLDDHVICEGTLTGYKLDIRNGIQVRAGASVSVTSGYLDVEDLVSEITGGTLKIPEVYVGRTGTGRFLQTTGTATVENQIWLGYDAGASGTYELDGGTLKGGSIYVGRYGVGVFEQHGGTADVGIVFVGSKSGSTGRCEVSGGEMSADAIRVSEGGTGEFVHTGGTVFARQRLTLGTNAQYSLSGTAVLSTNEARIGTSGPAVFRQTGGTHTVATSLLLGEESTGNGTYELSDGVLSAGALTVGLKGIGLFHQTGGSASAGDLSVGTQGRILATGGTFSAAGQSKVQGEIDFASGAPVWTFRNGALVDLGSAAIRNSENTSLSAEANTLVVFAPGFDPSTELASWHSDGVVGVAGQPIIVPAGRGFTGSGEFPHPVHCHGTVASRPGTSVFSLNGGLQVFPGGEVDLSGYLRVNNLDSGMSGGELRLGKSFYVGETSDGRFVQTGGAVVGASRTDILLGMKSGLSGTYEFTGGEVSAYWCYVGYGGTGLFRQGGTAVSTLSWALNVGYSGGTGTYELGDAARLQTQYTSVGGGGAGLFKHEGSAEHLVSNTFSVGFAGTYELSGGTLSAPTQTVGQKPGPSLLKQTGGSNTADFLTVNEWGRYELTGGSLMIGKRMDLAGEWDFGGGDASVTFNAGAVGALGQGTVLNAGNASMTAGVNSLLTFPSGFHPYAEFKSFSSQGLVHISGEALIVPAGVTFRTDGEFADHVECRGTVRYDTTSLSLKKGLLVLGSGQVDLGGGGLYVENLSSGISGGSIKCGQQYVGYSGQGHFRQTGGTNSVSDLVLADWGGSEGTYELSGGALNASNEAIYGVGHFVHTGGTNKFTSLYVRGGSSGTVGEGTYDLGPGSVVVGDSIILGEGKKGTFNHNGGTVTVSSVRVKSNSTYNLLSGNLSCTGEEGLDIEGTQALFNQSGGKNTVADRLIIRGNGCYTLSGGELSARELYTYVMAGGQTPTFVQTGGTKTVQSIQMHAGRYEYRGGELRFLSGPKGLLVQGEWDFTGASFDADWDSILFNCGLTAFSNTQNVSLRLGPHSMVVLPTGFDPLAFKSFVNEGATTVGTAPLVVPAGYSVTGVGSLGNRLECYGTVEAPDHLYLSGGIELHDGGKVDFGTRWVDMSSGGWDIRGGEILMGLLNFETGSFQQSGGLVSINSAYAMITRTTFELSGGTFSAPRLYLGYVDRGTIVQTGGDLQIADQLRLACEPGGRGIYQLNDGTVSAGQLLVGERDWGDFTQNGGAVTVSSSGSHVSLGYYAAARGYYTMNAGSLTILQNGPLYVGNAGRGWFTMTGGEIQCQTEYVGYKNYGEVNQSGGKNFVADDLCLASLAGSQGTYNLLGGTLTVGRDICFGAGTGTFVLGGGTLNLGGQIVRGPGTAQFIVTGGTLNVLGGNTFIADALCLGENEGDSSTFELQEGVLQVADATIGNYGSGTFELTGGNHIVENTTHIGVWSKSYGCYRISVGALTTSRFLVGEEGVGVFEFLGSSSQVTVIHSITFGKWGGCISIPGSKIHMTGAAFENQSTDPAAMAGLANLELIFEGGAGAVDPFEVASTVNGGFDLNFALGTLMVGEANVGHVQLVDLFDNGNRGTFGAECLFAHLVAIEPGSTLDLNGLRLYVEGDVESFLDGCVADGRLFDGTGALLDAFYRPGNDWTMVPEPATLALLALGAAALIRLRRRPADL